jgi:hypothetical protein
MRADSESQRALPCSRDASELDANGRDGLRRISAALVKDEVMRGGRGQQFGEFEMSAINGSDARDHGRWLSARRRSFWGAAMGDSRGRAHHFERIDLPKAFKYAIGATAEFHSNSKKAPNG